MTATAIKQALTDLNNLVLSGRTMEAFEKYYHPEVVMQENESAPVVGKEANRQREEAFLANVTELRGAQHLKVIAGEDGLSAVEWFYDYTHTEWGKRTYKQVSVQEWQDAQIIRETFYYGS